MKYSVPSLEPLNIFQKIENIPTESTFDFRNFACPDDELAYLFDKWVDYYKGKYAICKAIQPKSILEVGVRYGYSAISFLSASEKASYLGIDNDSNTFGGTIGALEWAKNITKNYSASFLLGDTQLMSSFPGDFYDLIHIDGQQDGDGTFHDLEMALEKGKYILVDGYFWSNENMLASTYFLKKYNRLFEYAVIIPGYAGELLIKTKDSTRELYGAMKYRNYAKLRDYYDSDYFLSDCGGYELFTKTNGSQLDERLVAVYSLVDPNPDDNILDMGFGRGELAYALAQTGASVTAIDYSVSAVEIAKQTYSHQIADLNLNYIQADVCFMEGMEKYQKIIAADIVEHLEDDALEKMMMSASQSLDKGGYMVIHTAPNLLNYNYTYNRKRKVAMEGGNWLPQNPRTLYEDLMHINEQTPDTLNALLKKYFNYVITWAASINDIGTPLKKRQTENEIIDATSIFAVASNSPIDKANIYALVSQEKLEIDQIDMQIQSIISTITATASSSFKIPVIIYNKGMQRYASISPNPVHLSYHIQSKDESVVIFDGVRTVFSSPLLSGQSKDILMDIKAPEREGEYVIQLTMVQEGCFWFETIMPQLPIYVQLVVK
jgi:2-polyprenyl-3-methyl-5-hydroxy-6-metoxy-1,4-benzoquinol methylase/predicted O-methyltransferase YrrM